VSAIPRALLSIVAGRSGISRPDRHRLAAGAGAVAGPVIDEGAAAGHREADDTA